MEEVSPDPLERTLQEVYRPFEDPAAAARCFAEAAVRATGARWVRVTLARTADHGPLTVEVRQDGTHRSGDEGAAVDRYPVCYQERELGSLSLPGHGPDPRVVALAQVLARHLMRLRVAWRARREHGREVALVGASRALAEVDRLLEVASRSLLPVLLVGPVGSEVERLGLALHVLGSDEERPFVQLHSGVVEEAEPERGWLDLFQRASGGTLLLAHLEDLEARAQHGLLQFLETAAATSQGDDGRLLARTRLVASVCDDLAARIERGALNERLVAALDVLRIELPPLRNRREDVPPLVEHFLRRHAGPEGSPEISEEAVAACVAHEWPGDRLELGRILARVVVTATAAPRLEVGHLREVLSAAGLRAGGPAPELGSALSEEDGAERLLADAQGLHPSLRRAVQIIVRDDGGGLTLADVATAAHVSRSHLSHLFRREMDTSFTRLVTAVRVARAKRVLGEDPWLPISAVASRAGFGHVRQMERAFRRVVGCTPSGYRDRVRRARRPRSR